ncbi:hypothetical protein RRG08_018761 [Elysia crispata]|uniref:Uncharacterized protein n=1 Tax=Elysia crispata TaxID=231223 RepID=A0AAE1E8A9_9GAST|nr:hypothetical protein RRG08_018761 [Elysia crispata]
MLDHFSTEVQDVVFLCGDLSKPLPSSYAKSKYSPSVSVHLKKLAVPILAAPIPLQALNRRPMTKDMMWVATDRMHLTVEFILKTLSLLAFTCMVLLTHPVMQCKNHPLTSLRPLSEAVCRGMALGVT